MPHKQEGKEKPAKLLFAGTREALDSKAATVACGWCGERVAADAEVCQFCHRDPRQPGAMADLLDRAEVIREARGEEEEGHEHENSDPLAGLGFFAPLAGSPRPRKK